MGFRYKIPYRYGFFIIINCVLMVIVYLLFYKWSESYNILTYYFFIMTEVTITTLLILRGETIRILKFAVIFSSLIFLVLIFSFLVSHVCCKSSVFLWASVLMGYTVFRSIYVLVLFLLNKKCCNEYDTRQILEQRMRERDERPFDIPFIGPIIPGGFSDSNSIQNTAPSAPPPTPGDSIGYGSDTIATDGGDKKAKEYGWAI